MLVLLFFSYFSAYSFDPGDHCVSYEADKKMFLLKTVHVLGKNCSIEARIHPVKNKLYLSVQVPIEKFDSSEKDRDIEVLKILGAVTHPNIEITSARFSLGQWAKWRKSGQGSLNAEIKIAGRVFKKKVFFKINKKTVSGTLKGKFSDYGLKPPSVGGGVVARVYSPLDLKFQFQIDRVFAFKLLQSIKKPK